MVKTLKYYFKTRTMFIGVLTGIVLLLAFIIIKESSFINHYYAGEKIDPVEGPNDAPFAMFSIIAGFLATIIPIYEFGFKMNKISIDQMYSLPIKREKLYLSRFIIGFLEIIIPLAVSFIYCILVVISSEHMYTLIWFLPYFLCLIVATFIVYTIFSFFFTRANTRRDGIIGIGFIMLFFCAVTLLIGSIVETKDILKSSHFIIYYPISFVHSLFNNLAIIDGLTAIGHGYKFEVVPSMIISLVFFTLFSVLCGYLFVRLNKLEKSENTMQISNSWFSFKFFIPAYIFIESIQLAVNYAALEGIVILIIASYIGYVIYRRSLKITKRDIITIAICIFVGIIIGEVFFIINHANVDDEIIIHYIRMLI